MAAVDREEELTSIATGRGRELAGEKSIATRGVEGGGGKEVQ